MRARIIGAAAVAALALTGCAPAAGFITADGHYSTGSAAAKMRVKPGTYRTTTATTDCEWSVYGMGDEATSQGPENPGPKQEVTLDHATHLYTFDCGEWVRADA